jgi:hypothetical protein
MFIYTALCKNLVTTIHQAGLLFGVEVDCSDAKRCEGLQFGCNANFVVRDFFDIVLR